MSPRTNRRTDGFGGSLANRARFGIMVHEAMRRRLGDGTRDRGFSFAEDVWLKA